MKNEHIYVTYKENEYASPEDIDFALEFQEIIRYHLPEEATEEELMRLYNEICRQAGVDSEEPYSRTNSSTRKGTRQSKSPYRRAYC